MGLGNEYSIYCDVGNSVFILFRLTLGLSELITVVTGGLQSIP
jgi:hypothetical protein